jgi:hypothetical protein
MSWEDVYFSLNVDPKDIIKALAQVFDIDEDTIVIEYSEGWHAGLEDDHIQMICRLEIVRGEFPIHLEIAPWRSGLVPQDSERYHIIGRLCDLLQNPALVMGDARNPYIWTLIHGEESYQYVDLDGDKLDFEDEIEVLDYLYRFNRRLTQLEIELGNLITCKDFNIDNRFREFFTSFLRKNSKEDLRPILSNIRLEARRMGREDVIDESIARL